jgi:hypothetical protein
MHAGVNRLSSKKEVETKEQLLEKAQHDLINVLASIKAVNSVLSFQKKVKEDKFLSEQIKKINSKTDSAVLMLKELVSLAKSKK